jgi:queuine tRNA-ribosyltransferase
MAVLEFNILKKSKKSRARFGILKTPHGEVETPALVTVATQAAVKTLTSEEVRAAGTQMVISNTFHLHLKPGEKIVKANGGLHKFMAWDRPIMTDSGGFQVFSLGFGRDHGIGKILKTKTDESISLGQQPKLLKITEEGVEFTSYVDGKSIVLTPKISIRIQEALGADIIFAFDEPTSPIAAREYIEASLLKTHRWAKLCLEAQKTKQSLYGIVQGGRYRDLRIKSAKLIGKLPFDGFGIGGEFGGDKKIMSAMLRWTNVNLPEGKPRHLLGIGHPEDIIPIIKEGVDTFDCIVPTHYARRGIAFISRGIKLDLNKRAMLTDKKPLDPKCQCRTCGAYSRSYIAHLFKAHEIAAMSLTTFHNLFWFNNYVARVREAIARGKI